MLSSSSAERPAGNHTARGYRCRSAFGASESLVVPSRERSCIDKQTLLSLRDHSWRGRVLTVTLESTEGKTGATRVRWESVENCRVPPKKKAERTCSASL